jgi:hypothetical protein
MMILEIMLVVFIKIVALAGYGAQMVMPLVKKAKSAGDGTVGVNDGGC